MLLSMNGSPATGWGRVGLFLCECGCGQTFFHIIKTRYPKYYNKTHRARAYRARARVRADMAAMTRTYLILDSDDWNLEYEARLQEERFRNRGRL
jgi:hypothetical protein